MTDSELQSYSRNYIIVAINNSGGCFEESCPAHTVKALVKHLLYHWDRSVYSAHITSPGTEGIKAELQRRVDEYEKINGSIRLP